MTRWQLALRVLASCVAAALSGPVLAAQLEVRHGTALIAQNQVYDFGEVVQGNTPSFTISVKNVGPSAVTIAPILVISNLNDPGRFSVGATDVGTLQPGATGSFELLFHAEQPGAVTNKVSLFIDGVPAWGFYARATTRAPIGPVIRLQLGATVVNLGQTVDFGDTAVGVPVSRTFRAYNDGDQNLSISPIAISENVNDPARFRVTANNVVNVPPGGSATFTLEFDAAGLGTVTSKIELFVAGTSRFTFWARGTVRAPDFALSGSPAVVTVASGQTAKYTISTTALFGFSGTIALSASGLPPGTTPSFTPPSVPAGGTSQFKVTTAGSAGPVQAALTLTGTSGALSRTTTVTLKIVKPDFSVSVAPDTRVVAPGRPAIYTVSVTPINGFSQQVTLSLTGEPAGATHSFAPAVVSPGSTSTLTVTAAAGTPFDDSTLTVTGVGGGLTRSDTVVLSLVDAAAPELDDAAPSRLPAGQVTNVTLTGRHLTGAEVSVAQTPADPGDPLPAQFPAVSLVSIAPGGNSLVARVDASDPAVLGFYTLVVDTPGGSAGAPVRIVGDGPQVDAWSPREPARGLLYSMNLLGINLNGAHVSVSGGPGVEVFLVASSATRVAGYLEVAADAPLGPRTLVVNANGRQTQVPITVVSDPAASALPVVDLTERAAEEAARRNERVPQVLMQTFSLRDDLAAADATSLACSVTLGWEIYRFDYVVAVPFDPATGRVLFDVLRNLPLGIATQGGIRIFSFFADLILQVRFNCFPVSHLQVCLYGRIGWEIPGLGGRIYAAGGCLFGGTFFPIGGTIGTISGFSGGTGGVCASSTQITPPNIGEQVFVVTQQQCCSDNLSITVQGSSFTGTVHQVNFQTTNQPVAAVTPNPAQCACPCEAEVDSLALKAGATKPLGVRLRNTGQNGCAYDWSISRGLGAPVSLSPGSGSATLAAGQEAAIAVDASLPGSFNDAVSPLLNFNASATSGIGACSHQSAYICPLPTGEVSTFLGFESPVYDVAWFGGTLLPSSVDWDGVTVTEDPPGSATGTFDDCCFPGSPLCLTDLTPLSGAWWIVEQNSYSPDKVGIFTNLEVQYALRTPCTIGTTQHMKRQCPGSLGLVEYKANQLLFDVRDIGTSICRDGVCSWYN